MLKVRHIFLSAISKLFLGLVLQNSYLLILSSMLRAGICPGLACKHQNATMPNPLPTTPKCFQIARFPFPLGLGVQIGYLLC